MSARQLSRLAFLGIVLAVPSQTFRSRVDLVAVSVSVSDNAGRIVSGLAADDFSVFEDDRPRPIAQFVAERVPLSLGIALDISQSMRGTRFDDTRKALRLLAGGLMPDDQVFLLAFNDTSRLLVPWTNDRDAVMRALSGLLPSGNTALFSAVSKALPLLAQGRHRKKALVVVSDGNDRESTPQVPSQGLAEPSGGRSRDDDAALESLRRFAFVRGEIRKTEALVYAIGIGSSNAVNGQRAYDALDISKLRELTDPTGGYAEEVSSDTAIAAAIARISDDLRNQYLIGFEPATVDGKYHRLRISTTKGYRVRTKIGYLATQSR